MKRKGWVGPPRAMILAVALVLGGCGAAADRICQGAGKGRGAFSSAIPLGASVVWQDVTDSPAYGRFFLSHYQWMTPENELKMDALQPDRGNFDFQTADAMVNWALAHGKHVHGHVLIWDSQLPNWLASAGQLSRASAFRIMATHIQTVLRHFRGRIGEWDVVNEAFKPDGSYKHDVWYRALGPGYIAEAFQIARATSPDVRLCYNDVGIETPGPHADAVLRLVKQLRARKLIDCVGFETHTSPPGPPESALATELGRFAATGVYVLISELDVKLAGNTSLGAQARTYADVARACRSVRKCVRLTTWGFTDATSWLGKSARALPFDARCRPKPAWRALTTALATAKSGRP
ncbi:MAG: endo-1,4-beta-xylanase [Solirubrobacteraceae bacterium]